MNTIIVCVLHATTNTSQAEKSDSQMTLMNITVIYTLGYQSIL